MNDLGIVTNNKRRIGTACDRRWNKQPTVVMYREWNSGASFRNVRPGCVSTTSCKIRPNKMKQSSYSFYLKFRCYWVLFCFTNQYFCLLVLALTIKLKLYLLIYEVNLLEIQVQYIFWAIRTCWAILIYLRTEKQRKRVSEWMKTHFYWMRYKIS